MKQLNFLKCYHAAELYREQSRSEEYVYNPLPSAETYLITRGSHATGKEMDLETQTQQLIPRKSKQHIGMGQTRLSRSSRSLRGSSSDGMLFLFLGITMGMMSNIGDNSREIDKLCELLKQTENLIHELHEELETKDQLTWKELANANEGSKSNEHSSCSTPTASSKNQEPDKYTKFDSRELQNEKMKNSEAMSKIEAELEAELERLELNMKRSSMGSIFQKDSNFEDFDPDKANEKPFNLSESDHDVSGTSSAHTQTASGVLSPQELSLRLHKVIESRLRARIIELEAALENKQKRLHAIVLESDSSIVPSRDLYRKEKPSSTQVGINFTDQVSDIDEASYE
ncbi:hypothetical protein P3X46_017225 [Hevea brasiliensis]|uniref:Uncharacterized protein n=2 Tax=Hevea brasiliensis TaxID=3981 RepID=A0ABQ9M1P6_HEVBR|nr:uncharacterized protein LOC110647924 [Hevea brasiliensis]KAJ9174167.1 hypothetical protein P3X46_017225 [Hevea brasiliensis]